MVEQLLQQEEKLQPKKNRYNTPLHSRLFNAIKETNTTPASTSKCAKKGFSIQNSKIRCKSIDVPELLDNRPRLLDQLSPSRQAAQHLTQ